MATKKTIPVLGKDDQGTVSTAIKGEIATMVHSCKPNREDPNRYNLTWALDFGKVSKEDVLKLAAKSVLIKLQEKWRKDPQRMDPEKWQEVTFNVQEVLEEGRQTKSAAEKAEAMADKMTAEEKKALAEKLLASLK